MYCYDFGGWGITSLHMTVIDWFYIYFLFLNPFPLTIIHTIVDVVAVASNITSGSLPNSIFGVALL